MCAPNSHIRENKYNKCHHMSQSVVHKMLQKYAQFRVCSGSERTSEHDRWWENTSFCHTCIHTFITKYRVHINP